ncbi:hypothetical protein Tco_1071106 [Tanacetum coccineum]|uniref:Uncharacterized protein n=1 Tax=Tanacetum coccineum TaxID=301880 RepID=A0ABQ5HPD5_9ASTR
MLAIDGVGFDWSDMAEEQVQTNMALMAFSDSEVYNDKTCTKTYLKNYETLKKQCDDLIVKLNQTKFIAGTYKRGLATVEDQLITYRKNEVLFSEEVTVLKKEVACKNYEINVLKSKFEKVKQEKKGIEFKIEKFDNALKSLTLFVIKKLDDSKENSDDSLVKEQVSEDISSFVESSPNAHCKYHQRERMVHGNNYNRVNYNYTTNRTHPNVQRNMVPRAVLIKTGLKPFNTARTVNTAHPKSTIFSAKPMHVKRGRDTKIPQSSGPPIKVGDEVVHKELGNRMERAATTASSLEAEKDNEFCDKHDMVAYLQKPEGSEAFHQIVNFLNSSHIKYALIENPKIYISSIQQFWGTATTRTTDDGEVEITASIDGQVKTVNEASLRRHLKLEDSDGTLFSSVEAAEIPQSQFPTQTQVADEATFISVDVDAAGDATTDIGLEAGQGNGTMHKTPTRPHDSPFLRVYTLGILLYKAHLRVKKLEKQQTNKLVEKRPDIISEDEDAEEDSSKQGRKISEINKDPTILLVQHEQDMNNEFDYDSCKLVLAVENLVTIRRVQKEKRIKEKLLERRENRLKEDKDSKLEHDNLA